VCCGLGGGVEEGVERVSKLSFRERGGLRRERPRAARGTAPRGAHTAQHARTRNRVQALSHTHSFTAAAMRAASHARGAAPPARQAAARQPLVARAARAAPGAAAPAPAGARRSVHRAAPIGERIGVQARRMVAVAAAAGAAGAASNLMRAPELLSWKDVGRATADALGEGFSLRSSRAPGPPSVPTPTLPTAAGAFKTTIKPVIFYRDQEAKCPYCERVRRARDRARLAARSAPPPPSPPGASRPLLPIAHCRHSHSHTQVWLVLEELGVPYDCVLIDLAAKPDWYAALVPTTKVPAIVLRARGEDEAVWESKDVMVALCQQARRRARLAAPPALIAEGREGAPPPPPPRPKLLTTPNRSLRPPRRSLAPPPPRCGPQRARRRRRWRA